MKYSSGKESPRDFQTRESRLIIACLTKASGWLPKHSWHLFAFQLVPCTLFNSITWTFLATKFFAAGSSMDPCHLACVLKSVLRDIIPSIGCSPNCLEAQWVWHAWVGADCSTSLSCGHLDLWGSWGIFLMTTCQSGVCLERHLKVLFAGLLR
jgi:hypothetical protein